MKNTKFTIVKFIVFVFLAVPLFIIGWFWISYIDKTISVGTAYGFSIGQSQNDAYQVIQNMFSSNEAFGINLWSNSVPPETLHPEVAGEHSIEEVKDYFHEWGYWELNDGTGVNPFLFIDFKGGRVVSLGKPGVSFPQWSPENDKNIRVELGQDYSEVYDTLLALTKLELFKNTTVSTAFVSRRVPVLFSDEEYKFIEDYDNWSLLLDSESFLNTIRLTFSEGALIKIHRHRQLFELP